MSIGRRRDNMYYLMNKDQKLLSFCVEKKLGSEICVQKES